MKTEYISSLIKKYNYHGTPFIMYIDIEKIKNIQDINNFIAQKFSYLQNINLDFILIIENIFDYKIIKYWKLKYPQLVMIIYIYHQSAFLKIESDSIKFNLLKIKEISDIIVEITEDGKFIEKHKIYNEKEEKQ
jgi:hypothetical protein